MNLDFINSLTFIIYSRSHTTAMKDVMMRPRDPRGAKMTNRTNLWTSHTIFQDGGPHMAWKSVQKCADLTRALSMRSRSWTQFVNKPGQQ